MLNKVKQFWSDVRSSLWFVPTLMVAAAIILALLLIEIDGNVKREWLAEYPRIFGAGADGSRGMLSSIAGSMITIAGLSFSLTIVAMAQTSSQYTSRILRNFMRDSRNQFILGFFVGVFAYCLVVLRTIRGGDEGRFIPSFAVFFGLILAIGSIGVLIFFIHHIATLIQASTIIGTAADETIKSVIKLFPEELGEEADQYEEEKMSEEIETDDWQIIRSHKTGFIQNVDSEVLIRRAEKHNCVFKMERRIGDFVVKNSPLVSFNGSGAADFTGESDFKEIFLISKYRTIDNDAAFGVRQIVDVALKALSPGINDTTTAVVCINYLSAILSELANRRIENQFRSKDGKVRVIARGETFQSLTDAAFNQIRDSADGNTTIYLQILDSIKTVAQQTKSRKRLEVLAKHIELVFEDARIFLKSDFNRQRLQEKTSEAKGMVNADLSFALE